MIRQVRVRPKHGDFWAKVTPAVSGIRLIYTEQGD